MNDMTPIQTLKDIPTSDLQRELSCRDAVQSIFLGPDDKLTKTVNGPAWVTVNRD